MRFAMGSPWSSQDAGSFDAAVVRARQRHSSCCRTQPEMNVWLSDKYFSSAGHCSCMMARMTHRMTWLLSGVPAALICSSTRLISSSTAGASSNTRVLPRPRADATCSSSCFWNCGSSWCCLLNQHPSVECERRSKRPSGWARCNAVTARRALWPLREYAARMSERKGEANQLVYLPRLLDGSSAAVAAVAFAAAAAVSASAAESGRFGRPTARFAASFTGGRSISSAARRSATRSLCWRASSAVMRAKPRGCCMAL